MTSMSANAGLLPERVEKAAHERVAAGTYQTLAFGVVDGDKSEIVTFGQLDGGKAPDSDTVYEIASITKTFTATLLAQAVISGHVTLDTPVAQLLPDFEIPSRDGKEITLGELATHYSGLPQQASGELVAAKLKAFLAAYKLPRDPGTSYEYSNLGFALLGHALVQLEHTTYGAALDKEILKPLGMTMSGVVLTEAMRAHLAPGHDYMGKTAKQMETDAETDAQSGAGAIRSTASDMLRYLKANMGIDPSFLTSAMKLAQQPRSDMGKTMRIGLAWMTTDKGIVWHNGLLAHGYGSFLGFTADGRRGVVILANTSANADDLGFATLDADAPLAPTYKAIVLPSASLDDYAGTYRLGDKFLLVFRMNDELFVRATGQIAIPIFPSAPNEFFANLAGVRITFTRDSNGMVSGLVVHQNGDHPAPRLTASELPPELKGIELDAATFIDYVGKYQFQPGAVLDVALKRGHLEAQLTGQPAFPIFASAKDKFFYNVADAQLDFEREAGGQVVAVVLHQNGLDIRAPRMTTPH